MKSKLFKVVGKVQGVFFMKTSFEKALEIGIKGWIRNELDGSVCGLAQGSDIQLDLWKAWLDSGPKESEVEYVEYKEIEIDQMDYFEIR